jgi:hypothetical protein
LKEKSRGNKKKRKKGRSERVYRKGISKDRTEEENKTP